MDDAVVFGAGSVGRGFIGQLFTESGYRVIFVDIDAALIEALRRRGSYTLTLVDNKGRRDLQVGPVTAISSKDADAVVEALAGAAVAATAVGAGPLQHVAPLIARGVEKRMAAGEIDPLNVIVCENLPDQAAYLRGLVEGHLGQAGRSYLRQRVGLVNAVIARMVPEATPEMRARDVSAILTEPYKELPVDRAAWRGQVPEIVGLQPVSPFAPYIVRKLYICNAAHAIIGYLGYRHGLTFAYEALENPIVGPVVRGALNESAHGLAEAYGRDAEGLRPPALEALVSGLWPRLANRALADPVRRLARDPLRKLAPRDRLVGPARLALAAGVLPENLAWGIAGALAFDAPEDASAQELQRRIAAEGVEAVLATVCEIQPDEPLGRAVLQRYGDLVGDAA